MNSAANVSLELDDIQRGVLQQRPSPYVGTYLLLRIDERTAGRELVRRLLPAIDSASSSANPTENASVSVAFTYRGLEALGVPQESLDSFAPEFRQGMAARATELGDRGESAPHNWEKPLGTSEVHVAVAALSRDSQRLEAMLERARRAHQELPGVEAIWRQDCYQLPTGRTSFGFKDGIGQPAVESTGIPGSNPHERPIKAGEFILGYPDETGALPAHADPRGPRPQRHLHGLSKASHPRRRLPPVPSHQSERPGRRGATRGQDRRPLAERGAARAVSPARRSPAGRRSGTQQRLPLRRRPERVQVPCGRARPTRQPSRLARPRRERKRSPTPHDPARHQLRPSPARGGARRRWRRPRHRVRIHRFAHRAPVRIRKNSMAERRHLYRRPQRERPTRRTERQAPVRSPSRGNQSVGGFKTCPRSS